MRLQHHKELSIYERAGFLFTLVEVAKRRLIQRLISCCDTCVSRRLLRDAVHQKESHSMTQVEIPKGIVAQEPHYPLTSCRFTLTRLPQSLCCLACRSYKVFTGLNTWHAVPDEQPASSSSGSRITDQRFHPHPVAA